MITVDSLDSNIVRHRHTRRYFPSRELDIGLVVLVLAVSLHAAEPKAEVIDPKVHVKLVSVDSLCFTPDSKKLIYQSIDNDGCFIYTLADGRTSSRINRQTDENRRQRINALKVAISPDGKTIATLGYNAHLWDLESGESTRICAHGSLLPPKFSPDGNLFLLSEFDDPRQVAKKIAVHYLNVKRAPELLEIPDTQLTDAHFSADGKILVVATTRGEILLYDTATWKVTRSIKDYLRPKSIRSAEIVLPITVASKANLVVGLGEIVGRTDAGARELCTWDLKTGTLKSKLRERLGSLDHPELVTTPDSKYCFLKTVSRVDVYSLAAPQKLGTLTLEHTPLRAFHTLAVSPDGKLLALGGSRGFCLYELGSLLKKLPEEK